MEYTSTQPIADQLKALVGRWEPTDEYAAMAAIRTLENTGWHPKVFARALDLTPGFEIADNEIIGYTPPTDQPTHVIQAVANLINTYVREMADLHGRTDERADQTAGEPGNIIRPRLTTF